MEAKKKEHLKLEKNSGLYFAIGMVLILALVYTALEWKTFDDNTNEKLGQLIAPDVLEEEIPPLTQFTPPPPPKIQVPAVIEIIENESPEIETFIEPVEPTQDTPIIITDLPFEEVETPPEVTWVTIEEVPVFPGCENSDDKRACFQEMIFKHVRKNFRYPKNAVDMGLEGRVSVIFNIKNDGNIGDIEIMRSPHKILGEEATRIFAKLPKMEPGKQRGKAVKVPFSMPITFKLH